MAPAKSDCAVAWICGKHSAPCSMVVAWSARMTFAAFRAEPTQVMCESGLGKLGKIDQGCIKVTRSLRAVSTTSYDL